mmetsp:Transcript_39595/g.72256  ORF Transcript_39595/g.72256 Transcript_39595/m.72256 type:complete len:168 (+) Transcript_39595:103-606(+)
MGQKGSADCHACCISTGTEQAVVVEQHSAVPGYGSRKDASDPLAASSVASSSQVDDTHLQLPDTEKKVQSTPDENQLFSVEVTKSKGNKLGLDVDYGDGINLRVTRVKAGLISDWNYANPRKRIDVNDFIVEINEVKGDSNRLLDQILKSAVLSMVVRKNSEKGRDD